LLSNAPCQENYKVKKRTIAMLKKQLFVLVFAVSFFPTDAPGSLNSPQPGFTSHNDVPYYLE